MKKSSFIKILSLFLSLVILVGIVSLADGAYYPATADEDAFPEISASAYVLADAKTGEVIFSHNASERMPIASITKIMTALVVLENTELNDVVTVMAEACGIEGSSVYLYEGEKLTVLDLLYALMLESANDAAVCLALHTSKTLDAFSRLMNEKGEALGLTSTHFNNPHGLEDAEHYSSALDVALVWNEAMKNEIFRQIVNTKTYRIDLSGEDGYRFLSNHNKLLKSFDSCIGGKTGFTKTAGRCLVSGAKKDDLELVMVTLNDPDDWNDHEELLSYAMNLYSKVEVADAGSVNVSLNVVGGNKNTISATNIEPLALSVRDVSKLSSKVVAPRFLYAPITETEKPIAKIVYSYDGKEIAELDLYPTEPIQAIKKDGFFKRLINFFK